jgi:hypothetical protein
VSWLWKGIGCEGEEEMGVGKRTIEDLQNAAVQHGVAWQTERDISHGAGDVGEVGTV